MPHTSIHWLLLALPFLATVWATGGAGLGRKRDEPAGPEDGLPGPLPEVERALTQVRTHVGNLNDRLASLDSRLQMLGESNKQLVNILRSCTAQLCLSNAEVGNWKDELACARNRQSQLEAQIAEQRQELERGAQQLRTAEAELAAHTRAAESAAERLAEAERSLPARALELEESVLANQHELTERSAQLVQARERCDELELRLEQREEELRQQIEARRSAESHAGELERSQPALVGGLEARVAQRDEELRQRAAALESLRGELAASAARGAELEEELRLQVAEQRRSEARLRELEQALPTRSAELEGRIAEREQELKGSREQCRELEARIAQREEHLRQSWEQSRELEARIAQRDEELRERLQQCGQLEARASQREEELRERARRVAELEEELRAEVQEQQAVGLRAGELEQELSRRIVELQARIEQRDEELRERSAALAALGGECTEISARCEALANTAGSRARELDEHEYRLAQATARIGELEAEVQRNAGQRAGERLPMDELAESRLSSILHGYAGQSAKPLPPAYLERVKERDLAGALCSLLGGPEPLSADSLLALGEHWAMRHAQWNSEPVVGEVVYLWADACYVRTGMAQEGEALLVIVAGMVDGTRRVVSVEVGPRDSTEAWHASLSNLARRGMSAPRLVIGEDGLGLWPALAQLGWNCAQQRCWDPRIAHAVEPLPKRQQRKAAELLRAISNCDTRAEACARKAAWVKKYRARRPEAVARLDADWERMLGLYSFPEEHWPHLRNTAVVESLLGELRLFTNQSKAQPRTPNGRAILWKLLLVGAQGLRKINSPQLLPAVAAAEPCIDGAFVVKARRRAS